MSYEQWLKCIVDAAGDVASRKFQEESWFPGGTKVSSPDELYLTLIEDCTFDLFFQTYGHTFTEAQEAIWKEFRSRLEQYYDQLPKNPDRLRVLNDPEWDLVRKSAEEFVKLFSGVGQVPS